MTGRTRARFWFAVATVLAIAMEVRYATDGSSETEPWTHWLIQLPWMVLMPAAAGFSAWLMWHLWDAKRRARDNAD